MVIMEDIYDQIMRQNVVRDSYIWKSSLSNAEARHCSLAKLLSLSIVFYYCFFYFFSIIQGQSYIVLGKGDLLFYSSKPLQPVLISRLIIVLGCPFLYQW